MFPTSRQEQASQQWRDLESESAVDTMVEAKRSRISSKNPIALKVVDGCGALSMTASSAKIEQQSTTHMVQTSTSEDTLSSRRNAATISLQIPHDVSSVELGKHLRNLLDLRRINYATS